MKRTLFALGALTVLTVHLYAENWPHWRGPAASGVSQETRLPARWSDTENVAWKAALRGVGISSPIVWGDLVIVTAQAGSGEVRPGPRLVQGGDPLAAGERPLTSSGSSGGARVTFLVSAVDRRTGRSVWDYELPAEGPLPAVHEKHNLASPSPVTDGERVYAWFGTGQIAALTVDGAPVWSRHLGAENGPFTLDWGHGSSPALHGETLYLLCYHEPA